MSDIAHRRREYQGQPLSEETAAPDPFVQFDAWFTTALDDERLEEATAMILATSSVDGRPSARTVLLKGFDSSGFTFYTNYNSRKARELDANPHAMLLFYWEPLHRQVHIGGQVQRVSREESEAYFRTRPRESQIGAWASTQSSVIPSRRTLEDAFTRYANEFQGHDIDTPPFWGGYRVIPDTFEFWQGQANRLHDRIRYTRTDAAWQIERLSP